MAEGRSKAFARYLTGQAVSCFGESVRFIAVTVLMHRLTQSGSSAAVGIALSALPGIVSSHFAGVLGERFEAGRLLVLIDFLRFLLIPLLLLADRIGWIYAMLILLAFLDVFYSPSRRKFILGMTGRKGALKANSLLTGASGAAYLMGPLSAGFLTDAYGLAPVILISSLCALLSGNMTLSATVHLPKAARKSGMLLWGDAQMSLKTGVRHCFLHKDLRSLVWISLALGFCIISVNLAFYPFAFDVLKVTAKGWSVMMTVYYGATLLSSGLATVLGAWIDKREGKLFFTGLLLVSMIWATYTITASMAAVLVMQMLEGILTAFCGILLAARLQQISEAQFISRIGGINDLVSNAGKLAGIGATAVITGVYSFRGVFLLSGAILFLFACIGLAFFGWSRGSRTDSV